MRLGTIVKWSNWVILKFYSFHDLTLFEQRKQAEGRKIKSILKNSGKPNNWIHLTRNSAPLRFALFPASDPSRYVQSGYSIVSSKNLTELPIKRAIILDNATCPYCGNELSKNNDTIEHVIGRKFVPKGLLNEQWNLIVRSCKKCNSTKSILENDISAITLAGRHWFGPEKPDKLILSDAKRKAENSISRKTNIPVKDSQEKIDLFYHSLPE